MPFSSSARISTLAAARSAAIEECEFYLTTNMYPFTGLPVNAGAIGSPNISGLNRPGMVRLFSAAAGTNTGYRIITGTTSIILRAGTAFLCSFVTATFPAITTRIGFINTSSSADCTNGAYLEIPPSGNAVAKIANNGAISTSGTIVTLSPGTYYTVKITINENLTATYDLFTEAGVNIYSSTPTPTVPNIVGRETGIGLITTKSTTGVADLLHVDFMGFATPGRL